MGRQLAVDFGMQPCMMTHVDEISFPCADTFRCRQRFRYALVRRVRLRPQGVSGDLCFGDGHQAHGVRADGEDERPQHRPELRIGP